jgi:Protein of unknown function (DUF3179)
MAQTFQPLHTQSVTVRRRRLAWLLLFLFLLAALAIVLTPVWLIQPFRPQTQTSLALSYALRRWSPLVTVLLAVLSALLCYWLARRAKWWRKVVLVFALVLVCGLAWLARQNHFEWMFHPLPAAGYARAPEAKFVADTDMVLAVQVNGEAVAYPIRQMAYHHVVADTVGGTPLVATY